MCVGGYVHLSGAWMCRIQTWGWDQKRLFGIASIFSQIMKNDVKKSDMKPVMT